MYVVDAEDEAAKVEDDEKEDWEVEEDEEARCVHEAGNLTDLGIKRREVGSVEDLAQQDGSSED